MSKIILLIVFFTVSFAEAKDKASKSKPKPSVTKKVSDSRKTDELGTSFSFDPASVRGKYNMASQGIARVEDEKVLDDLLGLRRSFKDREQQEASRR